MQPTILSNREFQSIIMNIMLNNTSKKEDACTHDVYIKGLCGNCGIRLDPPQSTSVSMIHSVPELKVSEEYAKEIGKADQERLISERKLVLLVDLDQTILHTTHEEVKNDPNVHSFTLWPGHPTYYTKLRPYLQEFLEEMSKIYELHIFTFGCRRYAHKIASLIDPDQKFFGNRILSRDESVDQYSKRGNMNNLFPCGDAMVCIIDDRSDVWRDAGNLIQVKPYSYFKTSISDGAHRKDVLVEDDESLERDVDKLEALLGLNEDEDENENEIENENENGNGNEKDPIEDPDDYLLLLPNILERIHDKWYMELDEQRQFLEDGESYKLPDIKDIIRRYLRKKF